MVERKREAKIGVAPYSDGSGYAATVTAYTDETGEPVFEINMSYRLAADDWPELRKAIDDALTLARSEPLPLQSEK
jgi:hypothetical protein